MKKKHFLALAIAGISLSSNNAFACKEDKMEKCYGVVKASKNDCSSSKKGAHSCAGGAQKDSDKSEWILLPKGTCERLTGGSLKGQE